MESSANFITTLAAPRAWVLDHQYRPRKTVTLILSVAGYSVEE